MKILQLIRNIPDIIFAYAVCKKKGITLTYSFFKDDCYYALYNRIHMGLSVTSFKAVFLHEYGHHVDFKKGYFFDSLTCNRKLKNNQRMYNFTVSERPASRLYDEEVFASRYSLRFLKTKGQLKTKDLTKLLHGYASYHRGLRNRPESPMLGLTLADIDVKANALRKYFKYAK